MLLTWLTTKGLPHDIYMTFYINNISWRRNNSNVKHTYNILWSYIISTFIYSNRKDATTLWSCFLTPTITKLWPPIPCLIQPPWYEKRMYWVTKIYTIPYLWCMSSRIRNYCDTSICVIFLNMCVKKKICQNCDAQ